MSDKNIQIVQQIYAAFSRGDVPAIMQHISDDLRGFGVVSEQRLIPWHIQIAKKQDVPQFFKAIAESSEITRFEPRDFAAGGDHVYCTISLDVTYKHNRKKLTLDNVMHRFTFKNGKVIEWRGTEDTARTNAAYNAVAV
jgi:ketosteroid isomerase-like protein